MNLQFFADNPETEETTVEEQNEQTTAEEPENNPEEKTFTQSELDKIIADRLTREKKKRDEAVQKEREEAERKRLEENEEYKELAEKLQAQLDAQKIDALKAKKETLLAKAGYTDEQVARYVKYIEGETDDEIQTSLDELKTDIPPTRPYVDPSADNGGRHKPEQIDGADIGRTMFEKLVKAGKVRK